MWGILPHTVSNLFKEEVVADQQQTMERVIAFDDLSARRRLRDLPWWFFAMILIAIYVFIIISSNAEYNSAFNFIKVGLIITVKTTLLAYGIALIFGLLAGLGRISNNVIIRSGHSNSSSLVGKTAKVIDFDELARFIDKGGKYSADRVYYSLIRSVEPFKEDGKLVDISSPMFQEDMICRLYDLSKNIDNMLGFWLPTWEMNPNLPFDSSFLQAELKKNPEAFWRDFGAQPS